MEFSCGFVMGGKVLVFADKIIYTGVDRGQGDGDITLVTDQALMLDYLLRSWVRDKLKVCLREKLLKALKMLWKALTQVSVGLSDHIGGKH
jgi:hypothetical protein